MINVIKILQILISLSLTLSSYCYSYGKGFIIGIYLDKKIYSDDLLSSGSNDHFIFSVSTFLFGFAMIIIITNLILTLMKKTQRDYSLFALIIVWLIQFIILYLINLDTSLLTSIIFGDVLLSIWLIEYFALLIAIIINLLLRFKYSKAYVR